MSIVFRWFKFPALTVLSIICTPAFAVEVTDARSVGGWFVAHIKSVALGSNECIANKTFADGTRMELTLTVGSGKHKLEFENEDWTSLNSVPYAAVGQPDPVMPLEITFVGTSDPAISGDFRVLQKSRYNAKPKLWLFYEADSFQTLLRSMAASRSLIVTSGSRNIGDFAMSGSKAAIIALVQCARTEEAELNRQSENDPFKK